jgi:hypothetical protein
VDDSTQSSVGDQAGLTELEKQILDFEKTLVPKRWGESCRNPRTVRWDVEREILPNPGRVGQKAGCLGVRPPCRGTSPGPNGQPSRREASPPAAVPLSVTPYRVARDGDGAADRLCVRLARTLSVGSRTLAAGSSWVSHRKEPRVDKDLFGRKVVTAAELEAMDPQERHEHFERSIVWDLDTLPPAYLDRLRTRAEERIARRDAEQAHQPTSQRDMPNAS